MPQQRLRLGVIGFAKGHVKGIMGHFARRPEVEWVAFADVPPAVPEQWHHRSSRTDNMRAAREEIRMSARGRRPRTRSANSTGHCTC